MKRDPHQQARELIACGSEGLTGSRQTWLQYAPRRMRVLPGVWPGNGPVAPIAAVGIGRRRSGSGSGKPRCVCICMLANCGIGKNVSGWYGCLAFWSACRRPSPHHSCGGVASGWESGLKSQLQFGRWALSFLGFLAGARRQSDFFWPAGFI